MTTPPNTGPVGVPDGLVDDLAEGGRALVVSILSQLAGDDLTPDAREVALLRAAGELRDRMDQLAALVAVDGERSVSDSGIVRLHPGIAEGRQCSIALAKVLASVGMTDNGGKSPRHQRAAHRRWENEARRRGA